MRSSNRTPAIAFPVSHDFTSSSTKAQETDNMESQALVMRVKNDILSGRSNEKHKFAPKQQDLGQKEKKSYLEAQASFRNLSWPIKKSRSEAATIDPRESMDLTDSSISRCRRQREEGWTPARSGEDELRRSK